MDKLRAIEYFVAAAREGSLSGAARHFEISVPAVAKMVGALEKKLGATLFDRTSRGLVLTADGERYLTVCESLIGQLADAEVGFKRTRQKPRGTVVVEAPPLLTRQWLLPALPAFHRRYPDLKIDLRMVDRVTINDAEASGVDALILLGWPVVADLVVRQIAQMRLLVCATPGYWARHDVPTRPKELENHTAFLVRNSKGLLLDSWRFRRGNDEEAAELKGWLVSERRDVVLDAVLTGEGLARFADLSIQNLLSDGTLIPILPDWEAVDAPPVHLLHRPVHRSSPGLKAVLGFLETCVKHLEAGRERPALGNERLERPAWYRRTYGRASSSRSRL
jgi:DNA-binding transcriptional LysR family regulator